MNELITAPQAYLRTDVDDRVDAFELSLLGFDPIECPLEVTFTPGMCIRTRFVPAGATLSSRIHRTEHPFCIFTGSGEVWSQNTGIIKYAAPYSGITKPGTRRALTALTDTIWITYHATQETDLQKLDELLFYPLAEHLSLHVNRLS